MIFPTMPAAAADGAENTAANGFADIASTLQDVVVYGGETTLLVVFAVASIGRYVAHRHQHDRAGSFAEVAALIPMAKLWTFAVVLFVLSVVHAVTDGDVVPLAIGGAGLALSTREALRELDFIRDNNGIDSRPPVELDAVADPGNVELVASDHALWRAADSAVSVDSQALVDTIVDRRDSVFRSRRAILDRVPIVVAFTEARGNTVRSGVYRYDALHEGRAPGGPVRNMPIMSSKHGSNPPTMATVLALEEVDPEGIEGVATRHQVIADALQAQAIARGAESPYAECIPAWATRALEQDRTPELLEAAEEAALLLHTADERRTAETIARTWRPDYRSEDR